MNRDALYRYFDQNYTAKRDILPRIPLGADLEEIWQEVSTRRRARATTLPILGPRGKSYWYVTTDKMISASETIVEELLAENPPAGRGRVEIAPLSEVFYTSFVEGSPMTMQAAMEFLQGNMEPGDIEEQMIANNCSAMNFAASNLYHPIDERFIQMLALILTENMDGGGRDYRTADWVEIPSMMGEAYELPTAFSLPDHMREVTTFLADPGVHPLIKAAVVHAWVLVTRPFPEGNERLARLLSSVILIRCGYSFFAEISLSGLIAKNGYPYYNAAANIVRSENGGDLTYFMEYYLMLLAQAVEERRRRKLEGERENLEAGMELARTALPSVEEADTGQNAQMAHRQMFDTDQSKQETVYVQESLLDDGNLEHLGEGVAGPDNGQENGPKNGYRNGMDNGPKSDPENNAQKGGEHHWGGAASARRKLIKIAENTRGDERLLAEMLQKTLEKKQYSFTESDLEGDLNMPEDSIITALESIQSKGAIRRIEGDRGGTVYTFCCGKLSLSDYKAEMIRGLNEMATDSNSSKDKRIGSTILKYLRRGYLTLEDYAPLGGMPRWLEDMKLAEQMGIVKKVTRTRYVIMNDAHPCFEKLNTGQKKRARHMYEKFGDETFSLDMVVATLDYSSSTASAYLHQFTLLRILDCKKEDVKMYQFLVNPRENPEVFDSIA